MFSWVWEDARSILKDCKAPASWGDSELNLILKFFAFPYVFDALRGDRKKDRASTILHRARTDNALRWGKLFADAPETMINALPKIESLLNSFYGQTRYSKKRDVNVCAAVVAEYAMRNENSRVTNSASQFCKRFWSDKANVVADELSEKLELPVTPRTIENARAEIRKRMKGFSPDLS